MSTYVCRHGVNAGAVNVAAAVNLDAGANAAPIAVPAGVSRISALIVCVSKSIAAVADGGAVIRLQLTGNGLKDGTQELVVGAVAENTTTTGGKAFWPPTRIPTDIGVIPTNQIALNQFMHGVDPGSPRLTVAMEFS